MTGRDRSSLVVRWSIRFYQLAIRTFPASFRAEFGDQLVSAFTDAVVERRAQQGAWGIVRQWRRTLTDLARHVPAERWRAWTGQPLALSVPVNRGGAHSRKTVAMARQIEAFVQDVRFAGRTLVKTPWISLALVATIGLGIGATTTIFTVVHGVLLKPLPFDDSERVVRLCEVSARTTDFCVASAVNAADLAQTSQQLEQVGVVRNEMAIATIAGASFPVTGGIATPGFFDIARLHPALGRVFTEADLDPGANQVVVVSDGFWRQHLGGDPSIVGQTLTIDGGVVRLVGILPADAYVPLLPSVEVWKPLTASVDDVTLRSWRGFLAVGRLTPGATREALDVELSGLYGRLAEAYPADYEGWTIGSVGLREELVAEYRSVLWIFQGAVVLVLLIACANVASLLLVRASTRSGEFAVRASLGAGRGRLFRQLLTESLTLSVAGAVVGVVLAQWATGVFVRLAPGNIPRLGEVSIDGNVALFALGLAALTAVVFGLAPARQASRGNLGPALRSRRVTPSGQRGARSVLVVGELALAFVLLVGAGLLTRALVQLMAWDPGFDRNGLTVSWMLSPPATRESGEAAVRALEQARDAVATVPGITAVGLTSAGPLFGGEETDTLQVAGSNPDDNAPVVRWFDAGPHYFSTLGVTIRRGRAFDTSDTATSPAVAVINETLARRVFPDEDPIGRRVTAAGHTSEIVGIVADVRPSSPDQPPAPEIYWPIRQYRRLAAYLVMRVSADAGNIEPAVRARLAEVDPGLQVTAFRTLDTIFDRTLISPRFNMTLLAMFAAVAISLALVGVYGVIAYLVASRVREFGVRLALGASPKRLVFEVMRSGTRLTVIGLGLGVVGAFVAARFLGSLLYGVASNDPLTFGAALVILSIAGLAAVYLPARRASRVDPLIALRAE